MTDQEIKLQLYAYLFNNGYIDHSASDMGLIDEAVNYLIGEGFIAVK